MLRVILRKVQGGLIFSAALLVVLAFQRLQSYDVPVLVGQTNHHEHEHDGYSGNDEADGSELIGHGHAHGRHRIFATNVIEIGLFRFVVPFRWTTSMPEDNEAARREPKVGDMRLKGEAGEGSPRGRAALRAAARPKALTSAFTDRPNLKAAVAMKGATTIAYAVPIHTCLDDLLLSQGLAVLSRSVRRYSTANPMSKSKYGYKMYALVHPDAEECTRNKLESLGFEVVVARDEHDGGVHRGKIAEHNKEDVTSLSAFGLLNHPIVVQLDPLSLVMSPLDDLFDVMLDSPASESRKELPVATAGRARGKLPEKVDAFLTRETTAAGMKSIRHGFLVVRTGRERLDELLLLTDNRSRNATWAGRPGNVTSQQPRPPPPPRPDVGLYSLYYDYLRPHTAIDLDPCVFAADGSEPCAKSVPDRTVKVASLASCSAPWSCAAGYGDDDIGRFCRNLHREWFQLRRELGILHPSHKGDYSKDIFLGYCKSEGDLGYVKYDVPDVTVKLQRWLFRRFV